MAGERPDWLRYFIRGDSTTPLAGGDVQSFLLSIGHQLARVHPELFVSKQLEVVVRQRAERVEEGGSMVGIRIEDLKVSPFYREAVLRLEQDVVSVRGSLVGIEVMGATLEPRLLQPDNLAHLALIDPALALLAQRPDETIVVLVDALDEIAAPGTSTDLLDWIAHGPALPPNVRFVLSSRPSDRLARLRAGRGAALREIHIDPASPQVGDDLFEFAGRALATPQIAAAVEGAGMVVDDVVARAVRRAAGNFLYLTAYARALADAGDGGTDLLSRLLRFSDHTARG